MPKISVIIPVYNVEAYVEKCVRSVLEQTFTDMEIICVDNGSTDRSLAVLTKLAQTDPRVRVFSVENLGPGHSRNKGLEEATGEYILFVDSDDFISPSLCEFLLKRAEEEKLDIACCEFYQYDNNTQQVLPVSHRFELNCKYDLSADKGDSLTDFANYAFASPFVWGKLYRRETIENRHIRFPLGAVEDVPFIVSCLVSARRVKRFKECLYYYRTGRAGSISGKNERMVLDGVKNFKVLEDHLRSYGVFGSVKETFWFNKMVLLIGDERVFAGRLGNVPPETVQKVYDFIRADLAALEVELFKNRNAWFQWKVGQFKKAVSKNDLKFPRRLRKLRNIMMVFLDPYFKLKSKFSK